ncbi:hypothetical protein LCGC14_2241260 [marine sediment metagenome]|uniref:Uncharacterized protein n=1 Tax=marine sediment metagenome TaxID=412755 RepID=A0A0F9DSY2_9ZZZZ
MPYDNVGFPASGSTFYEIPKENYFKVLEVLKKNYEKEVEEILKPKKTITYIEPLTKRDILGIIAIFDLDNKIPNANGVKVEDLRISFKKIVAGSKNNTKLKKYLIEEGIYDNAVNLKRKKIEATTIVHNKTKKIMNFLLEKYLNLKLT